MHHTERQALQIIQQSTHKVLVTITVFWARGIIVHLRFQSCLRLPCSCCTFNDGFLRPATWSAPCISQKKRVHSVDHTLCLFAMVGMMRRLAERRIGSSSISYYVASYFASSDCMMPSICHIILVLLFQWIVAHASDRLTLQRGYGQTPGGTLHLAFCFSAGF